MIPAGTYSFVKTDTPTCGDTCALIANAEVEEERVYDVIAAIFKNLDYLHSVHRALCTLKTFRHASRQLYPPSSGCPKILPGKGRFVGEAMMVQLV